MFLGKTTVADTALSIQSVSVVVLLSFCVVWLIVVFEEVMSSLSLNKDIFMDILSMKAQSGNMAFGAGAPITSSQTRAQNP